MPARGPSCRPVRCDIIGAVCPVLVQLAGKIEGAPIGLSLAEWALINKVLAPINFPLKFWLAHKWVEYRKSLANTELPEMPAIPTPVRASE